jgi:hypothetical protein
MNFSNRRNANGYISPAYHHKGLYEYLVMTKPINGLSTKDDIAPAEPDKPTTVEVTCFPNISLIDVM